MGAKRVSKQGVTVSQGNAIEVTNTAGTVLFSVDNTGNIGALPNLTAKGSLITASATSTPTTLAVGTNEQRLVADSATTSGLKYVADTTNYAIAAKGDLLVGTAADTVTALTVGSNGDTLVANSAAATGLSYKEDYAAGKNAIINGAFNIWQRGTSFSNPLTTTYTADRWGIAFNGTGATRTISQQSFTAGTAPVAGYEATYFLRFAVSVAGTDTQQFPFQRIEDVRTFANQTITVSYWAKADAGRTVSTRINQNFGSGGSSTVLTSGANKTLTTSWARYTDTITVPSISGKTLGAGNYLGIEILLGNSPSTFEVDIWGVQVEAGSVATAFQTATGTLQGELAACQRYYWRFGASSTYLFAGFGHGSAASTTQATIVVQHPVPMRITPTSIDGATLGLLDGVNAVVAVTSTAFSQANEFQSAILANVASGLTQYRWYRLGSNNSASGYLGLNAEL